MSVGKQMEDAAADQQRQELAAIKIQGLARGKSVRKRDVMAMKREEKAKREQEKREKALAAVQIQRHFRGYSFRNSISNKEREISKMQFRERHETVSHVKPEDLHRTASQINREKKLQEADKNIVRQAHEIRQRDEISEEWAAVKIQSMYKGFSTRKAQQQNRQTRSRTENEFRKHKQDEVLEEEHLTAITMVEKPVFEVSNTRPTIPSRTDHLTDDGDRPSQLQTKLKIQARRREEHKLSAEDLASLEYATDRHPPDEIQMKAMEAIRFATMSWSSKYVMHIEPEADSNSTDEVMRFTSVWSTPVLYRPVPRTTIHIHFSVPTSSVEENQPEISFRVENQVLERTIASTKGVALKESWIDRVIMDKEKLRKTFKMAA